MLDFIRKNEKRILIAAVIVYIFLWIFVFDSNEIWVAGFLPLFITIGLVLYERIASKTEKEKIGYFDLKEFRSHAQYTIDSLEESFKDERPESAFTLRVILSGEMHGEPKVHHQSTHGTKEDARLLRSPLSGTDCIAYRITAGCVKPRDIEKGGTYATASTHPKYFAKYSLYLFTIQESVSLQLHQSDDSVRIGDTGIFNFTRTQERVVSWNKLSELGNELEDKVENELKLREIAQKDYTGIVVREQVLQEDETCTVYGTCSKDRDGIVISGNDSVNDPDSLYITTLKDDERQSTIASLSRSIAWRRLIVFPAIAILLGIAGYFSFKDFFIERGNLSYQDSPRMRKLEIARHTEKGNDTFFWNFEPSAGSSFTLLLGTDKQAYSVTNDSILTLYNVEKESADFTIGKDLAISWEGSYWGFQLGNDFPVHTTAVAQKGKIYIKNALDKEFGIRFDQKSTATSSTYTWSWTPRLGMSSDHGTYAITYEYDKQGKPIKENEVILETGDSINVFSGDTEISRYIAGYSPEVQLLQGIGWTFVLSKETTTSRNARLYVKTTSAIDYRIEVFGEEGKKKYDTWWDFEAGQGFSSDQGDYLALDEDAALVFPGDAVRVTQIKYITTYKGAIRKYEYARYDFIKREWKIYKEE